MKGNMSEGKGVPPASAPWSAIGWLAELSTCEVADASLVQIEPRETNSGGGTWWTLDSYLLPLLLLLKVRISP